MSGRFSIAVAVLSALAINAEALNIALQPSASSIYPESPLALTLSMRLDESEQGAVNAVLVDNECIEMRVFASTGEAVSDSPSDNARCRFNPRPMWMARFVSDPTAVRERQLVFNEWCTTDLVPGAYKVVCELSSVDLFVVGEKTAQQRKFSPPMRFEFALEVRERNDDKVKAEYESLLTIAQTQSASGDQSEMRAHALDAIINSNVPLAIPYQIMLLNGDAPYGQGALIACHLHDIASNLINNSSPEIAADLINALQHLESNRSGIKVATFTSCHDTILYILHEIHATGSADVVRLTQDVVDQHTKTSLPFASPD